MSYVKGLTVLLIVMVAGFAWPAQSVDCVYRAKNGKADRSGPVREYKNCGICVGGRVTLSRQYLGRLHYDNDGLATVFVQGQHYYVKRNGSMLPVVAYDKWADDYSEGLVRSAVEGKIAFYDRGFKQIILPRYDWAAPFAEGRALVCIGCKDEPPDEEGHTPLAGGTWGYIDKKGEEVIPLSHTRKEAEQMW